MKLSRAIRIVFILAVATYPFIIFFGIQVLPPSFLGLMLLMLLTMRYGVLLPKERQMLLPLLLLFFVYAIAATLVRSTEMLLYYPALVNFSLLVIFAASLRRGEPLLLRIVRARGVTISRYGPAYLYRLTMVWAGFFAVNGLVSMWTVALSIEVWTLYNGLISYALIAALVGGEYVFRGYYKRRMGV
ncbi:MAG: hypothetical protein WD448_13780 [Woeseia sp.]